jgi:aspartate racemase
MQRENCWDQAGKVLAEAGQAVQSAGCGLDVLVPDGTGRQIVHRVIYDELCRGVVREASRAAYQHEIRTLITAGAEDVILGCTEIELLIRPEDSAVQVFPTTRLHAETAVEFAIA